MSTENQSAADPSPSSETATTESPTSTETTAAATTEAAPASTVAAEEGSILDAGDEPEAEASADAEAAEGEDAPLEITIPEGITANEAALTEFKSFAKENGIGAEQAQKLFDMYAGEMRAQSEKLWNDWQATQKAWKAEIASDPELGGDALKANMVQISKGIDALCNGDAAQSQAVRQALKLTGAGNNPAIVRLLFRASQQVTEGRTNQGGNPVTLAKSPAGTLYPEAPKLANQLN